MVIRTHNPSRRVAADPRLRLRGHWDRSCQCVYVCMRVCVCVYIYIYIYMDAADCKNICKILRRKLKLKKCMVFLVEYYIFEEQEGKKMQTGFNFGLTPVAGFYVDVI